MRQRLPGILLFLPVPLVLGLFTLRPLGATASLLLGIGIMGTHRFYARPYALKRASLRCLWCGVSVRREKTSALRVREPGGTVEWRACPGEHESKLRRLLGSVSRHKRFVRGGIGLAVFGFLAGSIGVIAAGGGPVAMGDLSAGFRLLVAAVVLPVGWLGPRSNAPDGASLQAPFPLHIQALIGTAAVMFLFRWIGLLWLIRGAAWFLTR